jgi:uncharacterized protein with GYD domain
MQTYVILYKFTDQGIKNIKDIPRLMEDNIKNFEATGGKVIGVYTLMGEYDIISIGEAPSDEIVMTFLMALGARGNVRTTTLKAFTKEQFTAMVKKLP